MAHITREDLPRMCAEIIAAQETGMFDQMAGVRALAKAIGNEIPNIPFHLALDLAKKKIADEAMMFVMEHS